MMTDYWVQLRNEEWGPAQSAAAITPNDSVDLTVATRGIYVGSAGDVKVDMLGSGTVTFTSLQAGTVLPVRATRVYSTGTDATGLIALW